GLLQHSGDPVRKWHGLSRVRSSDTVRLGEQVHEAAMPVHARLGHPPRVGLVAGEDGRKKRPDRSPSGGALGPLRAVVSYVVVAHEAVQRGVDVTRAERGAQPLGSGDDRRCAGAHAGAPACTKRSAGGRPGRGGAGRSSGRRIPGRNRKPNVTTAPRTPAATSVCRTPMSDATGAAAAYDNGSNTGETKQSTLDTPPSSRPGTSRCFAVAQAIVPAASIAFTTTHA